MRIAAAVCAVGALLATLGAAPVPTAAEPPPPPTTPASPSLPAADDPPPGPGLDLIKQKCVACHPIAMITSKRKTPEDWATTVDTMAGRGAEVSPEEMDVITQYLSKAYSASTPSSNTGR